MNSFVGYRIEPAFGKAAADHGSAILQALAGELPRMVPGDEVAGKVRAAAGLLIARAARGDVALFASRSLSSFAAKDRDALVVAAQAASDGIGLPATLLSTNWTVDPFGLKRLFNELVSKIVAGEIDGLIPVNPHDYLPARKAYESIFMRAQRLVNLSASRFPALVAGVAVKWMQGTPYPVLLADAIRREERSLAKKIKAYEDEIASNPKSRKRRPKPIDINDVIRKEFDLLRTSSASSMCNSVKPTLMSWPWHCGTADSKRGSKKSLSSHWRLSSVYVRGLVGLSWNLDFRGSLPLRLSLISQTPI